MVDEGRQGVAVDDGVGEEAPAGCGRRRVWGFAASVYEWVGRWDGMGVGNHGLGTRLSKMWGKLQKYPHRFVLGGSFSSGVSRAFRVSGFHRRWEFSRAL